MKQSTVFERKADMMVADMDDEIVMMDVEQGSYFAINQVGAHVWTKLETPQSFETLVQSVQSAFDSDDKEQIQNDVGLFLKDLAEHSLIREITE